MPASSSNPTTPLLRKKEPLYRQIAALLELKIDQGTFGAERLPTERQLAREFGVSVITIKQSLNILENKGLVVRRPRKGTFVRHSVTPPNAHRTEVRTVRWLRVADLAYSQSVDAAICEKFESLHAGWRVVVEDVKDISPVPGGLEHAIRSADVLSMNIAWFTQLFCEGRLLELDAVIADKIDPDAFFPPSLSQCRVGGRLFGLPRMHNPTALYMNSSMFERLDIELPVQFDSWDALAATLRQVPTTWDGVELTCLGYFGRYALMFWENFLWQHGGNVFAPGTGTCILDQEEAITGLEAAASFLHGMPPGAAADLSAGFPDAFERHYGADFACFMGGPFFSQYLKQSQDHWVVRPLPTGGTPCTGAASYIVGLNSSGEASDEAVDLVSLICGRVGQDLIGRFNIAMPSLRSSAIEVFAGDATIDLHGFIESVEHVRMSMPWQYHPVIRRILDQNIPLIYTRAQPAAQVCRRIASTINVVDLKPNEVWSPA